jgi:hypothetical protein
MPSTESKSGWGQGGVVNGVSKDLLDLRISEFLAVGGVPQDAVSVTAFTGREGIVKQINPQSYVLIIYSYDDMQYLPLELPGLKTVSLCHGTGTPAVCDGKTSPHRPRLVVSRSTCPPISPPTHANSFVLGPAVINTHPQSHTHWKVSTTGSL